jgi:hypothetical protein
MTCRHFIVCMCLTLAARPALAQPAAAYLTTLTANIDVAYHETRLDSNVGAHVDLAGTVRRDLPMVEAVGEAGFNHFSDATVASLLGGARVRIPIADNRFLPFAAALLGLYHCSVCNENDLALQAGGGVDFRVPHHTAFRLRAELDFRHVFAAGAGFDALRLSGGIVLPLSGR